MSGILDGKIVFVTGGGGGIGRATSLVMAREVATLAVADSDLPMAEETVAQVRATGHGRVTRARSIATLGQSISVLNDYRPRWKLSREGSPWPRAASCATCRLAPEFECLADVPDWRACHLPVHTI